jgi:hypothetical protein
MQLPFVPSGPPAPGSPEFMSQVMPPSRGVSLEDADNDPYLQHLLLQQMQRQGGGAPWGAFAGLGGAGMPNYRPSTFSPSPVVAISLVCGVCFLGAMVVALMVSQQNPAMVASRDTAALAGELVRADRRNVNVCVALTGCPPAEDGRSAQSQVQDASGYVPQTPRSNYPAPAQDAAPTILVKVNGREIRFERGEAVILDPQTGDQVNGRLIVDRDGGSLRLALAE